MLLMRDDQDLDYNNENILDNTIKSFGTDSYFDGQNDSCLRPAEATNCRKVIGEDWFDAESTNEQSIERRPTSASSSQVTSTLHPQSLSIKEKGQNMEGEGVPEETSQLDEIPSRILQRERSGSDSLDRNSSRSDSRSDTRSDTDVLTKMMYDLWGSKEQEENFPAEETSTQLTTSVEKIVARELYEMNRDEREAIIEELHGVKSRAVAENPEMVESALASFQEEAEVISTGKIKEMDTDINGNKHPIGKAHIRAVEALDSNYVTAPEFRIRFLRAEFFDVKKAVLRYCRYLNHVWDLFGDIALVRQIELGDLTKKELKYLKGGQIQGLLSRDKMGRRIFAVFGIYEVPIRERTRVEAYLSFSAIADDETTQINGAASLVFLSLNEKSVVKYDNAEHRIIRKMASCAPVRYTAMHFCMPNEPIYNFFKTVVHALIRPEMRASTRFHSGSHMECNYALCQFGIPVDDIPKSVTGTIKSKSIQKFVRARMAIEEYRRERCQLLGVRYVTKAMEDALVEAATSYPPPSQEALEQLNYLKGLPPTCPGTDCPELDCIVFGDRVTYKHPPNVKFRDYLRGKRHRQEELKEQERQQHGKEKRRKERIFSAEFLDDIIDEAFDVLGFKFATYDKDAGWYTYIKPNTSENRQELRKKISQLMRDERKRERASMTLPSGLGVAAIPRAAGMGGNPTNNNYSGSDSEGQGDMGVAMPFFVPSTMEKSAKRYKKMCRDGDDTCGGCNFGY